MLIRLVSLLRDQTILWHVDGYDKLSPYGFTVHGCIDGLVLNKIDSK